MGQWSGSWQRSSARWGDWKHSFQGCGGAGGERARSLVLGAQGRRGGPPESEAWISEAWEPLAGAQTCRRRRAAGARYVSPTDAGGNTAPNMPLVGAQVRAPKTVAE